MGRFIVFRWQDQWLSLRRSAALVAGAPAADKVWTIPAQTGAGLTKMVPVPWIAARYSEYHPAHADYRDAHGYSNEPLPAGSRYSIVMVGDSFMLSLGTQNVAQVLGALGNINVYNHAREGAGPFLELSKFIRSFRIDPPPEVVVWNLTGRELGAPVFLRQPVETWFAGIDIWSEYQEQLARVRWRRDLLAPTVLSRAWPNTSILAYLCRNAWAKIKLIGFRAWPGEVLGAEDPRFGPMLFYRENLRMLPLLTPEENAPGIVQVLSKIAMRFKERGQTLVVLLVPEKEQIHMRALSPADQAALAHGPELFAEIESGLEAAGTPVVNLMPVFQKATASGLRLYWRDDTHWNDAGIRLAAEEIWRTVEPLLTVRTETSTQVPYERRE